MEFEHLLEMNLNKDLSAEEKIILVEKILGKSHFYESGQCIFYTGITMDSETGDLRNMEKSDYE